MATTIKVTLTGAADISARKQNAAKKAALIAQGEVTIRDLIPKHFTPTGEKEYGYQPRTREYQLRKTKIKGHRNPLVWSGTTRSIAKNGSRIVATSKKLTVKIPAPILNRLKPGKTKKGGDGRAAPDARKELMTVSDKEIIAGCKLMQKTFVEALKANSGQTTIVI